MSGVIFFKFKTSIASEKLTFDGHFITVGELKRLITDKKKLGNDDSTELVLSDPRSGQDYTDDSQQLPRNTSVQVRRAPIAQHTSLQPKQPAAPRQQPAQQPAEQPKQPTVADEDFESDLFSEKPVEGNDEQDALLKMLQGKQESWQQEVAAGAALGRGRGRGRGRGFGGRQAMMQMPCERCGKLGHYTWDCPDKDDVKRVRAPTGIPMSRLAVNKEGGLVLPGGVVGSLMANEDAFAREMAALPTAAREPETTQQQGAAGALVPAGMQLKAAPATAKQAETTTKPPVSAPQQTAAAQPSQAAAKSSEAPAQGPQGGPVRAPTPAGASQGRSTATPVPAEEDNEDLPDPFKSSPELNTALTMVETAAGRTGLPAVFLQSAGMGAGLPTALLPTPLTLGKADGNATEGNADGKGVGEETNEQADKKADKGSDSQSDRASEGDASDDDAGGARARPGAPRGPEEGPAAGKKAAEPAEKGGAGSKVETAEKREKKAPAVPLRKTGLPRWLLPSGPIEVVIEAFDRAEPLSKEEFEALQDRAREQFKYARLRRSRSPNGRRSRSPGRRRTDRQLSPSKRRPRSRSPSRRDRRTDARRERSRERSKATHKSRRSRSRSATRRKASEGPSKGASDRPQGPKEERTGSRKKDGSAEVDAGRKQEDARAADESPARSGKDKGDGASQQSGEAVSGEKRKEKKRRREGSGGEATTAAVEDGKRKKHKKEKKEKKEKKDKKHKKEQKEKRKKERSKSAGEGAPEGGPEGAPDGSQALSEDQALQMDSGPSMDEIPGIKNASDDEQQSHEQGPPLSRQGSDRRNPELIRSGSGSKSGGLTHRVGDPPPVIPPAEKAVTSSGRNKPHRGGRKKGPGPLTGAGAPTHRVGVDVVPIDGGKGGLLFNRAMSGLAGPSKGSLRKAEKAALDRGRYQPEGDDDARRRR